MPTVARENAKRSAVRHLLQTFFDGSAAQAISTLLDVSTSKLTDKDLTRLARLIDAARDSSRPDGRSDATAPGAIDDERGQ